MVKSSTAALAFSRKGAAAVETALVLPLLTTMVLGVLEFGTVVYSYSLMQFATNRVARTVAVNRMTSAEASAAVGAYLPGWLAGHHSVSVSQSAAATPESNLVTLRVSAAAADATPLALITRAVPWQLTASSTMKQELPYVE